VRVRRPTRARRGHSLPWGLRGLATTARCGERRAARGARSSDVSIPSYGDRWVRSSPFLAERADGGPVDDGPPLIESSAPAVLGQKRFKASPDRATGNSAATMSASPRPIGSVGYYRQLTNALLA
jgi:hypothetical protein